MRDPEAKLEISVAKYVASCLGLRASKDEI
jgi:hypothetical protein